MLFLQYPVLKTAPDLFKEFFKECLAKQAEIEKAKAAGKRKDGVDVKELEQDLQKWKQQKMQEFKAAIREKLGLPPELETLDEGDKRVDKKEES